MTENFADVPSAAVTLTGCLVIVGFVGVVTVRVTALLYTVPPALETWQRYCQPFIPEVALTL